MLSLFTAPYPSMYLGSGRIPPKNSTLTLATDDEAWCLSLVPLTGESNHMLSIMRINTLHFVVMKHLFTRLSSKSS